MPFWLRLLIVLLIIGFFPKLCQLVLSFAVFSFLYKSFDSLSQWQIWDASGWFVIFCVCVAGMPRLFKDWSENNRSSWSFLGMRFYYFCVKLGIFWLVVFLTTLGYGHYIGKNVLDAAISTLFILVVLSGAFATKFNFVLTSLCEMADADNSLRSKLVEAVILDNFSPAERITAEGSINVAVANFRKFIEPQIYIFAFRLYIFGTLILPVVCLFYYKWYFAILAVTVLFFVPGFLAFMVLPKAFEDCWFDLITKDLETSSVRHHLHFDGSMPAIAHNISSEIDIYRGYAQSSVAVAYLSGGLSKWSK